MIDRSVSIAITAEDRTRAAFASAERNLQGLDRSLKAMRAGLAGLVSGFSVGLVVSFSRQIVESVGALGELAEQLGLTTDSLQALQYVAAQGGLGDGKFDASIKKFVETLGSAQEAVFDADHVFNRLGVALADNEGRWRANEVVLVDFARAVMALPTEAQRAAMAVAGLGKGGQAALPFLRELAEKGLGAITEEADKAGAMVNRQIIEQFDALSDKWEIWKKKMVVFAAEGLGLLASAADDAGRKVATAARSTEHLAQVGPRGARPQRDDLGDTVSDLWNWRPATAARGNPRGNQPLGAPPPAAMDPFGAAFDALEPTDTTSGLRPGTKPQIEALKELEKATRDYERALKDASTYANDLFRDPAEQLGRYKTEIELSNDAIRDQRDEVERLRDSVATPWEKASAELERYNELLAKGALDQETYDRLVNRLTESFREQSAAAKDMDSIGRDLGLTFSSAFEDAVIGGKKLQDVFRGLAQDLLRLAIRQQVTEPLLEMFSVAMGGSGGGRSGGGFLGSLLEATIGGWMGGGSATGVPQASLPPGGFATGTMSAPRGLSWVGEEGPELVRFGGGERVFNARASARMAGGGVTINQTLHIGTGVAQTVRAEIMGLMPEIRRNTTAAVADAKLRGGGMRAALAG